MFARELDHWSRSSGGQTTNGKRRDARANSSGPKSAKRKRGSAAAGAQSGRANSPPAPSHWFGGPNTWRRPSPDSSATLSQSSFLSATNQQASLSAIPVNQRAITYNERNEIESFGFEVSQANRLLVVQPLAVAASDEQQQQQQIFRHSSASIDHKSLCLEKFDSNNKWPRDNELELYRQHLLSSAELANNASELHAAQVINSARRSLSFKRAVASGSQQLSNHFRLPKMDFEAQQVSGGGAALALARRRISCNISAPPPPPPPPTLCNRQPLLMVQPPNVGTTTSCCDEFALRTPAPVDQQQAACGGGGPQIGFEADSLDNIQMIVDEEASLAANTNQAAAPTAASSSATPMAPAQANASDYDSSTIRPLLARAQQVGLTGAQQTNAAAKGPTPGSRTLAGGPSRQVGAASEPECESKQVAKILSGVEHVVHFDDLTNESNSNNNNYSPAAPTQRQRPRSSSGAGLQIARSARRDAHEVGEFTRLELVRFVVR